MIICGQKVTIRIRACGPDKFRVDSFNQYDLKRAFGSFEGVKSDETNEEYYVIVSTEQLLQAFARLIETGEVITDRLQWNLERARFNELVSEFHVSLLGWDAPGLKMEPEDF